jgi:sugar phosphate permease
MTDDLMKKAKQYGWIIFWILAFGYILVYFHRLCPAVVAVEMMKDLKTTGALTGFLGAAYFYPYAAMQLPAGLLSDSWGPRNTITLFFIVAFVGSIVLGLAPTVFLAIAGRTLVGLGVAMLFVPTMKILAEWFHAGQFAMMTGILMALGGIGSLIAATPLVLLSNWIGWRMSFVAVGGFTLILALLVWLIVRDRPSDMGWPSPAETTAAKAPPITLKQGVVKVLTTFAFWPIAVWFFFEMGVFFSYGGLWGGPYLMQVYGYSKAQSGHILSMLAIGMIIGSPLLSYISNNVVRSRKIVIVFCSAMVLCITALLSFFTATIPLPMHYLICLSLGIFGSAVVVIGFTTNKELFPVQMAGTATGLVNLFPFAGGAVFQPVLGYVLEKQGRIDTAFTLAGYRNAFMVLFVCGMIALVASLFFKETMVKREA